VATVAVGRAASKAAVASSPPEAHEAMSPAARTTGSPTTLVVVVALVDEVVAGVDAVVRVTDVAAADVEEVCASVVVTVVPGSLGFVEVATPAPFAAQAATSVATVTTASVPSPGVP